jgi:cytolysin-activating lysine-acyltransferase
MEVELARKQVSPQNSPQKQTPAKAGTPPAPAAPDAVRPSETADARQARMAQNFASVVAVLMRDPGFRNLRLTDLEWLVLPPLLSGQWRLGQSRIHPDEDKPAKGEPAVGKPGTDATPGDLPVAPTAVALWASVSPEIDKRLSSNLDKPLLLKPHEWASGDIVWLVAAAGDPRAVPKFLKHLAATKFKGREVKLRVNGDDGKVVVRLLGQPTA